jgi:hypothetical protein
VEPDDELVRLAAVAADGGSLHWEQPAAPAEEPPVRRALEGLAAAVRTKLQATEAPARDGASLGLLALCSLAALRALYGLALTIGEPSAAAPLLLAFVLTSFVLLYSGDRDARAIRLGVFYLLVAATLATRPIAEVTAAPASWARLLSSLQPEAFLGAAFVAVLVRFPAAPPHLPAQVALHKLSARAGLVGWGLFLVSAAAAPGGGGPVGEALVAWSRTGADGRGRLFWAAQFVVMALGARHAIAKVRLATGLEGRRVAAFLVGVIVGLAPLVLLSLGAILVPGVEAWIDRHEVATDAVVHAGLLSLPVTTAGAVAAGRVLSLRLLARRALSYLLARTTLGLLFVLPAMLLAGYLYVERDRPLAEVLESTLGSGLLRFAAVVALLGVFHGALRRGLDRLFARGEGDRGASLSRLIAALAPARGRGDVAQALVDEVTRSLGAVQARVFVRDPGGQFVPVGSACRPLPAGSALLTLLEADARPFEAIGPILRLLPEPDRAWLSDLGVELLVSVPGSAGEPAGLLALGERVSEEPWDREAKNLAQSLASAAGVALARAAHERAAVSGWDDEPGVECRSCSRVRGQDAEACRCGARDARQAALPAVVLAKFRLERRLGEGGMGVVYAAEDLALGRRVALKTLPRSSSSLASRLRSEARILASISHPGVATLFGAETWKGVPFLVVEHLAGETLADRLARGPLPLEAALPLARTLATTLADLHELGLIHRDLKPANVGFREDGRPKLLDFGLAHLLEVAAESDACLAGTPLYLPPEAWEGAAPAPAWDVWAMAVVVHESLVGAHPFKRATEELTLRAIREGARCPLDRERVPVRLASVLEGALARAPGDRRPATARAFAAALSD